MSNGFLKLMIKYIKYYRTLILEEAGIYFKFSFEGAFYS